MRNNTICLADSEDYDSGASFEAFGFVYFSQVEMIMPLILCTPYDKRERVILYESMI